MTRLSVAAAALVTAACANAPAPPANNPAEVRAAIAKVNQAWVEAGKKGDAKAIGDLVAQNATVMNLDFVDIVGRDAIVADWEKTFKNRKIIATEASIVSDSIEVFGDDAFEVGHTDRMVRPMDKPKATPTAEKYRYITFWHKDANGQWRPRRDFTVKVPATTK